MFQPSVVAAIVFPSSGCVSEYDVLRSVSIGLLHRLLACYSPSLTEKDHDSFKKWKQIFTSISSSLTHWGQTLVFFLNNLNSQCQNQHRAHLVLPPPPAGQCAEPGTSPHRTAPRSCPLPPTAGRMYSMTRCHTLKDHVSDHAHRICWMIDRIREKEVHKYFQTLLHLLTKGGGPKTPNLQ